MILVVGNTKGGVGKTTLAVQIGLSRARAGRRVWLVDADVQGTASSSIQCRADAEIEPALACSSYSDPRQLRSQVKQQGSNWDDIIIDVGGRDTGALRAALMLADVVLVPFAPMSFDLWAMEDMAKVIEEVNAERDGLVSLAVMNQAEPRAASVDNADAAQAVREIETFTLLEPRLVKRKAFSASSGSGLAVAEQKPVDPRAVAELDRLVKAIYEQQEGSH
ncbi:AAA family ATPase [Methylobacterium sp. Leaf361]|uniref:AAA family ATPase n=1 Tax=Methylobacterium sp. Leaf361 TaxID=1736352 RepID=UPI0009E96F57|nr:AAA family ATPase [Methylobacterium sp. Leaf361]